MSVSPPSPAERARVTIGQMADFDFPGLCKKVYECAKSNLDNPTPDVDAIGRCEGCGVMTTMASFCLPCCTMAAKVIAETAETMGPDQFRAFRTGEISRKVYR